MNTAGILKRSTLGIWEALMRGSSAWVRLGAVAVMAGLLGLACTDGLTDLETQLTITVTPELSTLASIGEQVQLGAKVDVTSGSAPSPVWVTRNVDVAAVGDDGRVRAVGNGETWIVAIVEANGLKTADSARIVVSQVPIDVRLETALDTLTWLGQSTRLVAVARDALGSPVENAKFTWTSSNPGLAQVDSSGMVTAVDNGDATISVGIGEVTANIILAIAQEVATVTVTPASPAITVGATQQFTATAEDAGGTTVAGVKFLWVSANANVAVVDTTGLATGTGVGAVTITAVGRGEPGNAVLTVGSSPTTPTKVFFSVQPTNSIAGEALSPAVEVELRDASDNLVTSARNAVTLAIAANPGSGALSGTKTVTAVNGIASFSGLSINKAAAGYTLSATSPSLTSATSGGFAIAPAAPVKLAFGTQPGATEGNVTIAPAVTVTILDQYDNVVTGATNPVTLDLGVNPWRSIFSAGGTLDGTKTVNATGGTATFNNLRIAKPAPGYTLAANAPGLIGAGSAPFDVNLTVQSIGISSTAYHTCAVAGGGTYCWGRNYESQLGDGTAETDSVARLVAGGLTFTQIAAAQYHTCALTAAGAAYCWGYNPYGELGDNSTTLRTTPVAVSGGHTFSAIRTGAFHTCGIEGTTLYCWGRDVYGALGDDASFADKLVPTAVAGGLQWGMVTLGQYHTCGLTTGGDAYCWGYDGYGQLGDNNPFANQGVPVAVKDSLGGVRTWKSVSAGRYHTCGVDANDDGFCWGYNGYGQLGVDTATAGGTPIGINRGTPILVFGALKFSTIRPGAYHTCALTTSNAAYCWGNNYEGELGNGTTGNPNPLRTLVSGGLTFDTIRSGFYHTCGVTGTDVWCWGYNGYGQLGDGSMTIRSSPVQIVQ